MLYSSRIYNYMSIETQNFEVVYNKDVRKLDVSQAPAHTARGHYLYEVECFPKKL